MVSGNSIHNKTFVEILFIALPISLLFSVLVSELIVFILIVFYLYESDKSDKITALNEPIIILLFFIWVYLIINYLINIEKNPSLTRTFFFIRFPLLILSINYFINIYKINLNKVFMYWFILIVITCFDLFFQLYFKKNILGYEAVQNGDIFRLGGFMNDELKISKILFNFGLLVSSFLLFEKKKLVYLFFLILIILTIFITNERANFISAIIFLFFIIFFSNIKRSYLRIFLISLIVLFTLFGFYQKETSSRMMFKLSENIKLFKISGNKSFLEKDSAYFAHWSTAYQIFKDNKLFGVGEKNFRNYCDNEKFNEEVFKTWQSRKCSTHPHNFYFETLAELGVIGLMVILSFFIYSFFKFFKILSIKMNRFFLFNSFIILIYFIPILPRGSFFNNWNSIIFWTVFSFLYSNYHKLKNSND